MRATFAFRHLLPLAAPVVMVLSACESFTDSARLGLDLERRYPGSAIAVRDLRGTDARTIEVTIRAVSFGDLDLGDEARVVAEIIQRRFDLSPDGGTVAVVFEADRRMGVLSASRNERFEYPVAELGERSEVR